MNERTDYLRTLLSKRHSEYALAPEWVAEQKAVEQLLEDVLQNAPTHFNAQTVRMVLLTGEAHKAHWRIIEELLIQRIGEERYNGSTRAKIEKSFASGVGTVLFFDDLSTTKRLQEKMPAYAANFVNWAQQVQGSHQLTVWLGLTQLGFGANLQHYIGLDDDKVRAQLQLPNDWAFIAQMPFGKVVSPAGAKEKLPIADTLKVFK